MYIYCFDVQFNLLQAYGSLFSPFEPVTYSIAFYFLIICTILIGFPIQYLNIF